MIWNAFILFPFIPLCRLLSLGVSNAWKFRASFQSDSGIRVEGNERRKLQRERGEKFGERYYPLRVGGMHGRWMLRFRVLVPASHPPSPRSSGSTRIENPLSLFLRRDRRIFTLALREFLGVAKTSATFTGYFATLAKLNAVAKMRENWRLVAWT